ncbi:MAG: tyrosine-type recombinase/integrase [Clostridiales bacterium]|nr:tyrosine-type recombinase/integrase [Clostridiales bacterium]
MGTYHAQQKKDYTLKLRKLLKELPSFCGFYFRAKETQTSVLTRYGYAIDLRGFFEFLTTESQYLSGKDILSLTLEDLNHVTTLDIELYLEKMSIYAKGDKEWINSASALARKLSAVRSLFKYLFKQEMLRANVAALVDIPKLRERAIIRLEANEVADLLDTTESGSGLTKAQLRYHEVTRKRDTAILTLFLGTGIRISELVGIDTNDIDFEAYAFRVTRKGGDQEVLAFGQEVGAALQAYEAERKQTVAKEGHETAFFLSLQRKRITVRAVENLVKKYATLAAPLKKITPHKLRSTYGTMLYQESNDIYLVADVLGHKDVNTTRKHYAALSEEKRRTAAKMVKLRDDPS